MSGRPPRSAASRAAYASLGVVAVGIGAVGLFVPLLPTTPFLLVAAWAFALGSPRLHEWLVAHPRFGPLVAAWRRDRAIPLQEKVAGVALVWVGATVALVWQLDAPAARGVMIGVAVLVTAFLLSFPSSPRGARRVAAAMAAGRKP